MIQPSSSTFLTQARFFFELEHRLGAFIDRKVLWIVHLGGFFDRPSPKERMLLMPVSQRILLVILFFEIRLLLRSLKPYVHSTWQHKSLIADICCRAQWLSRVISWILSSEEDVQVAQNDTTSILKTLTEVYSALQRWSLFPQKVKSPSLHTHSR